jgi:hypothetical protein
MRVGRGAARVCDIRIDQAARSAAMVVKQADGRPVERFLRRFVAALDAEQPQPEAQPGRPAKPPGRPR